MTRSASSEAPGAGLSSYAQGATGTPLRYETVGACLRRVSREHPRHAALVSRHQQIRLTYEELDSEVDRLARGLCTAGLARGDRIGVWSPNRAEWALLQFAAARIGLVLVTINPAYRPHELEHTLKQSGSRMVISASAFKNADYRAMIDQVRGRLPELERVVCCDDSTWEQLLDGAELTSVAELGRRELDVDASDPVTIQYTSGTTGTPKGVTLSHHNILNNGFFIGEGCRITDADRICVPVPYYHCFGMITGNLVSITHGACVVLPNDAFSPQLVLDAISEERCTVLHGVPTMFIEELAELERDPGRWDVSSLRTGVMGGASCPVEMMRAVIDRMNMREVTICYGMTETSPVSTQTLAEDDFRLRTTTVGCVHPHVEIRIADPSTGRTVPRGEVGEFQTRGYSVMLGYWNEPVLTAATIDSARWLHTGDLATMDDAGYIRIVGRIKDMVIRGGENISPREVEEFLFRHPDIEDVHVVGVPDERLGEELMAWIRKRPSSAVTQEMVREFCRGQIAHYKIPRYIRFTEEFPMTVTGKVQKFKLRELAVAELGLQPAIVRELDHDPDLVPQQVRHGA